MLLGAIVVLGPWLGSVLFAPRGDFTFWPHYLRLRFVRPEPSEQAGFAFALLAPLLLAGGAVALAGRPVRNRVPSIAAVVGQVTLAGFVIACIVAQQRYVYEPTYFERGSRIARYFTIPTLLAAIAIAALIALALRHRPTVGRLAAATRETTGRRVLAIGVATLVTLTWLLSAFNTDGTIDGAHAAIQDHIAFWSDEAWAVLNGHYPLVNFHVQYGHLWSYLAAGGLKLFGTSLGVYAAIMLTGAAAAMAAVFATLRRIARSSLLALALFLPFLATSAFLKIGPPEDRYTPLTLFSLFPIRYLGPYVLLWLVVRRIEGTHERTPVALGALASLVAINNPEFGLPAFGATLAACAWAARDRSWPALARLGAGAAAGVACGVAIVAALTLVVAGSLPAFEMLLTFPRIFGAEGFGLLGMPPLGLHLVIYMTFAAAIVVATVRAASDAEDRMLTGALAWTGVFGLGVGAYFVGRSHPHVLIDLFSIWSLTLMLLTVVAVRAILRRPTRRPSLAELLVLAGFGVAVCSLAQTPPPWSQVERLRQPPPNGVLRATAFTAGVRQLAVGDAPVALLVLLGQRIAYDLGLVNVAPYVNIESMMTTQQWQETVDRLRRAGGTSIIVTRQAMFGDQVAWLRRAGYAPSTEVPELGLVRFDGPP